jgi:uncharacterized protein YjbJ (UPF0337 family)
MSDWWRTLLDCEIATVGELPKMEKVSFQRPSLYDNQSRSMLDTPQRYPRAGSQSYPTPAAVANSDGSTTVYFGPSKPAAVSDGNWIQTVPGELTDDDLDVIAGKRDQLEGKIQERYGLTKDQVRSDVDTWYERQTWQ